jgi:hypothetical protein
MRRVIAELGCEFVAVAGWTGLVVFFIRSSDNRETLNKDNERIYDLIP